MPILLRYITAGTMAMRLTFGLVVLLGLSWSALCQTFAPPDGIPNLHKDGGKPSSTGEAPTGAPVSGEAPTGAPEPTGSPGKTVTTTDGKKESSENWVVKFPPHTPHFANYFCGCKYQRYRIYQCCIKECGDPCAFTYMGAPYRPVRPKQRGRGSVVGRMPFVGIHELTSKLTYLYYQLICTIIYIL